MTISRREFPYGQVSKRLEAFRVGKVAFAKWSMALFVAAIATAAANAADNVTLQLRQAGPAQGALAIHSVTNLPVSSMYSEYRVLRTTNLTTWEDAAAPISGGVGVSDELLRSAVPLAGNSGFYRVERSVKLAPEDVRLGAAIYGYGDDFSRQLQQLGQLSLAQFISDYSPTGQYLTQLSFNPTNAEYWPQFNARLQPAELAIIQTNGFVVSGRMGTYSFPDSFYKLFTDDLPVFFSCDAALHAWHRSYMGMLEELEESYLSPRLQAVLQGMAQQVTPATGTALENGMLDADFFVAVARSLVTGTNTYGSLGQTARVSTILTAISNLQPAYVTLFGSERKVDFSQFQVRGHYETSTRLQKYFRAMMWCGMIDFRFTGATNDNSLRELSGTVAMHLLLKNSGQFANWQNIENVLQLFVGVPDSLTFAQLSDLMTAANIQSPASLPTLASLQSLQASIMSGQLGVQNIQSGYFWSPRSREQIKLPRSFCVLGQRFAFDAWTMNQCVFDRIIWDEDGLPEEQDKVMRRVPSALDIAFSVLGNNNTVPELAASIANTNGHPWRDGYPYQHNLAAVRRVIDAQTPAAWTNNIYHYWLACLRELSAPTTSPEYPDALRTYDWAMKTLNTQLASWTELRHDTVLYVKQPYTGNILCSYPDGFIEPRVAFWERMRDMALGTKALLSTLPKTGTFIFEPNQPGLDPITNSIGAIYTNRIEFLDRFASNMVMLAGISAKELSRQALSSNETYFIQSLIENPNGYSNIRQYSGWYPKLFFLNTRALNSVISPYDSWDALVTDVHTDPTEPLVNDPGSILHEAVGNIALLMVAVNWGPGDAAVYAGPVMTHYEFELGPTTRQTDSQWKTELRAGTYPPQPPWTQGYLVPGVVTIPWDIY